MSSPPAERTTFDFRNPVDFDHAVRIGRAWIELRRGAGSAALRDYFFGKEHPLEQGQMDALDLLTRRDRTMKGLAERLHIDPSSATRAVQRIVKDGLAERYPSPEDGRVVMVRVTREGRRRHAAVARRREIAIGQIVGSFGPDERAQLADLMDRLIEAIDDVVASLHDDTDDDAHRAAGESSA
ncbi:MAG: MarR family transcriptional regulator [Ilumatobacter sp.]|nr:MarR family transcriptional regulator [Ilumatobacter sp.]